MRVCDGTGLCDELLLGFRRSADLVVCRSDGIPDLLEELRDGSWVGNSSVSAEGLRVWHPGNQAREEMYALRLFWARATSHWAPREQFCARIERVAAPPAPRRHLEMAPCCALSNQPLAQVGVAPLDLPRTATQNLFCEDRSEVEAQTLFLRLLVSWERIFCAVISPCCFTGLLKVRHVWEGSESGIHT